VNSRGFFALCAAKRRAGISPPYLADNRAAVALFQAIVFSEKKKAILFARCEEDLHHRTSPDQKKHLHSDEKGHNYPFAGPVIPVDRAIKQFLILFRRPASPQMPPEKAVINCTSKRFMLYPQILRRLSAIY
jgi:hypothetical protein